MTNKANKNNKFNFDYYYIYNSIKRYLILMRINILYI